MDDVKAGGMYEYDILGRKVTRRILKDRVRVALSENVGLDFVEVVAIAGGVEIRLGNPSVMYSTLVVLPVVSNVVRVIEADMSKKEPAND